MDQDQPKAMVSVIVPVFNEAESLPELYQSLCRVLEAAGNPFEILFIDDGSHDGSQMIERNLAAQDDRVIIHQFRRNRGKAAALNLGFAEARGDYVVTIDADMQDDPEAIPALIAEIGRQNVDLISGWKQHRQDPFIKKYSSRLFNGVTRLLTGIHLHDMNNGLKAYRAEVVKTLDVYGELHRYIPVLAKAQGFRSGEIKVRHFRRKYGKTKYGMSRFYKGLLDLLTVLFVTRFMRRPMHFFGLWGGVLILIGFLAELWVLILKYFYNEPFQTHLALLIFGVLLLVFGMQFLSLGLLSEMITFADKSKRE